MNSVSDEFDATDKMFEVLEKEVDNLRRDLYKEFEPKIQHEPPVDLDRVVPAASVPHVAVGQSTLPPAGGQPVRSPLTPGLSVIAMRHSSLQNWKHGTVDDVQKSGDIEGNLFKVKY